ncbi:hypothetical protein SDJN03_14316, partial [Cucurbita argyrosperma subsp. sororia]
MAVTKNSFLVGLLAFLCLSLSSANRVLKNNDAEKELLNNNVSSEQDNQLQDFNNAELKSIPEGNVPKLSSVGSGYGDCGGNCGSSGGGGYTYPPNYGSGGGSSPPNYGSGGGSSGCQPCYTYSPCPWQGCPGFQGCQGCQGGCQGCQGGCQGCQAPHPPCTFEVGTVNDSKIQDESIPMGEEPEPPVLPENHHIKSSGGANQDMKSNGGLV